MVTSDIPKQYTVALRRSNKEVVSVHYLNTIDNARRVARFLSTTPGHVYATIDIGTFAKDELPIRSWETWVNGKESLKR